MGRLRRAGEGGAVYECDERTYGGVLMGALHKWIFGWTETSRRKDLAWRDCSAAGIGGVFTHGSDTTDNGDGDGDEAPRERSGAQLRP